MSKSSKKSGKSAAVKAAAKAANQQSATADAAAEKTAANGKSADAAAAKNSADSESATKSEAETKTDSDSNSNSGTGTKTESESAAVESRKSESESESRTGEKESQTGEKESQAADSSSSSSDSDPLAQLGRKELRDLYMRTAAEKENLAKRAEAEIKKARDFAIARFAPGVCEVRDCLESALAESEKTGDNKSEDSGVSLTLRKLTSVMESNGILPVRPDIGAAFDANLHQAIGGGGEGENAQTISQVMRCGYTLNGRLIRPAIVWLGKSPPGDSNSKTDSASAAEKANAAAAGDIS